VGQIVAKIHQSDHTHGDLTTSNIILTPQNQLFLIDFGLTQSTISTEDKAVDLHLFKRMVISSHGNRFDLIFNSFLEGYRMILGSNAEMYINQIEKIEMRGRYNIRDE
jgi:TP53 regulating kinase-like protein